MKVILAVIFLIFLIACSAQNKVSDEVFINLVYITFVDNSFSKYYLSENNDKYYFIDSDIEFISGINRNVIPDSVFSQLPFS